MIHLYQRNDTKSPVKRFRLLSVIWVLMVCWIKKYTLAQKFNSFYAHFTVFFVP